MKILIHKGMSFGMLFMILSMAQSGFSQGCVAIRAMSCSGQNGSSSLNQNSWLVGSNFRYFQSFRHFRGHEEEKERLEKNTEVINDAYTLDLNLGYGITERLSVSANLPLIHYDRSSLYEHYGNSVEANPEQKRFSTSATGIGDLRIGVNYSVTNPMKHSKFNLLVGAGVKFPTGKENVTDEFHKISSQGQDSIFVRPVDQSIQLGDGGYGFNLEFQSQYAFSSRFSSYINGFYLVNPKNTNNTITRGVLPKTPGITDYHSVADQYAARAGVNYMIGSRFPIGAGLGGRVEGIPASDLIGDSEGFRRPGYIISAEPSLSYSHGPANFLVSVPYALYRNRIKSTDDKADPKGLKHGDAAFADYLINFSFSYRFGGKKHAEMESGMEH